MLHESMAFRAMSLAVASMVLQKRKLATINYRVLRTKLCVAATHSLKKTQRGLVAKHRSAAEGQYRYSEELSSFTLHF